MKTVKLSKNSSVVYGRSPECGILVPDTYMYVSRCQCTITLVEGKAIFINDLFSSNGTDIIVDGIKSTIKFGKAAVIPVQAHEVILMPEDYPVRLTW